MGDRRRGQPPHRPDLKEADLKRTTPVRVVDYALAEHGWSRTERGQILRAIKNGRGDIRLSSIFRSRPRTLALRQETDDDD